MKRIVLLAFVTLMAFSTPVFAHSGEGHEEHSEHMTHGKSGHDGMTHDMVSSGDGMDQTRHFLMRMKGDVRKMETGGVSKTAMKEMNRNMMSMHGGMDALSRSVRESGDLKAKRSVKVLDQGMMSTMKGMGMVRKDPDKGVGLMKEGIAEMERALDQLR